MRRAAPRMPAGSARLGEAWPVCLLAASRRGAARGRRTRGTTVVKYDCTREVGWIVG